MPRVETMCSVLPSAVAAFTCSDSYSSNRKSRASGATRALRLHPAAAAARPPVPADEDHSRTILVALAELQTCLGSTQKPALAANGASCEKAFLTRSRACGLERGLRGLHQCGVQASQLRCCAVLWDRGNVEKRVFPWQGHGLAEVEFGVVRQASLRVRRSGILLPDGELPSDQMGQTLRRTIGDNNFMAVVPLDHREHQRRARFGAGLVAWPLREPAPNDVAGIRRRPCGRAQNSVFVLTTLPFGRRALAALRNRSRSVGFSGPSSGS